MLAKLIGYAPTREMAIARLLRALEEYFVGGIKTNVDLFRRILKSQEFATAKIDTGWLDRWLTQSAKLPAGDNAKVAAIAAALFAFNNVDGANGQAQAKNGTSAGPPPQPRLG